jgi:oxygen-independent coproporphyrinogen-3 oxidase
MNILRTPIAESDDLALYVHWPFCVSKCPYCDFNSHVRAAVDQAAWRDALIADLRHEAALLPDRRIGSVFFGGGTPSLMPSATVAAILDAASAAGVNRVSLGLQSLDDRALHFLGRAHDVAEGVAALRVAQSVFARVSIDLIYARPGQPLAAWQDELARALAFGTEHISLYQLTIEPGTRFATEALAGRLVLPDQDEAADIFETTRAMTAAAGLPAYETSNHARPGAESRHNLTYWRYRDYAGIGPGAHGRRGGLATVRHRKPENWLAAVARNGHGLQTEEPLLPHDRATEALLMGLRLTEGVDLARIARLAGGVAPVDARAVARLSALGLMVRDGDRLRVTEAGALLLDAILPEVVMDAVTA